MQTFIDSLKQMKTISLAHKSLVASGVFLPLVAVVLDRFVFKGNGTFSAWSGAGYALIMLGVLSMTYWLLTKNNSYFLARLFAASNFLAWVIGVVLFLPSVLGILIMGVGLLGLIPFGTAYVFFKAARINWKESVKSKYGAFQFGAGLLTVLVVMVLLQIGAHYLVERGTQVFNSDAEIDSYERILLTAASPFGVQRNIVKTWMSDINFAQGVQVAQLY